MSERSSANQPQLCFHCGLDVPANAGYSAEINGQLQPMCCPGCQAVAEAIAAGGLENYYKHRTGDAQSPNTADRNHSQQRLAELKLYDEASVQQSFVNTLSDGSKQAALVIEGITCAACVWLLEHHLSALEGVTQASVNMTNHRAQISWNPDQIELSTILGAIYSIGYQGHPYHPNKEEQLLAAETRRATRRLGIAGIFTMQIMMLAAAIYADSNNQLEQQFITFIRWASFVLATPVVFYAARPFFDAAWRDLKTRSLTMDVPVSIAIGGAYTASVWATATASGEVYFDSVSMFTFFLLVGRYLEMKARHRTGRAGNSLLNLLPASATVIRDGQEVLIPATDLKTGDRVIVKPGHTVSADGIIIAGNSSIDESALTGEYLPLNKQPGDKVVGGTINVENPLEIEVTDVGAESKLSSVVRLLDRAHQEKPAVAKTADKIAGYFVAAVLITAITVALIWWNIAPEHALWVTLSVLVVTCPCALSLATPTALTAATGALRENGILITRGHVLESLSHATHIVFDKTGTLTEGNLSLQQTITLDALNYTRCLDIAAALEAHSEHPIAKAFHPHCEEFQIAPATDLRNHIGEGLEGTVDGIRYRIGKPEFASSDCPKVLSYQDAPDNNGQWLLLVTEQTPLAWFCLNDPLRKYAAQSVQKLQQQGLTVTMLTGDNSAAVGAVSQQLNIDQVISGVSPEEKLQHVQQLQAEGARVIMVGDGINDIPVLAGAQISIAMGAATDLAKTNADAVLISSDLQRLPQALNHAKKTQRIIRQNLGWALVYNIIALPLAASGLIAPYMAAIGMSASSLVVVGNALRLSRLKQRLTVARQPASSPDVTAVKSQS
ncbi:heavy metal translocating P-type ATPase [Aliamphritea hakodatensis]|uniref:heavy metal translocating P-type ATPase n=1 Tax=Aliamphritea hakodatensis TaxID=2895352 RepID=UPI0022FDA143|nr:heavy metal translocating P-type ATPase [Aliamphritea hakodatensis]